MGQLAEWRKQNWVRIGTDGSIKGPCGTSKNKKILIDAYQNLKQIVCRKQKEQQPPARKKLQELEEHNLWQIRQKQE